jgi:aldose 1-epimerase
MALSGQQFVLTDGEFEATVVEVGAGLRSFRAGGTDVTEHYGEDELPPRATGATLMPWPNRLRDGKYDFGGQSYQLPINDHGTHTANHGLGRWERWEPTEQSGSAVTLALDLVPQTGWVFELRVEVDYVLGPEGLTVTGRATNTGERAAPFGAGWHPYFSLRGHTLDEVELTLPAAQHLDTDEQQVPTGRSPVDGTPLDFRAGKPLGTTRLDDGFAELTGGRAAVRTPSGGAELRVDESINYLQCFTPDDWAHGRPAIAIEPMSCPADAFNNGWGLTVLEPGQSWTGSWTIVPLD